MLHKVFLRGLSSVLKWLDKNTSSYNKQIDSTALQKVSIIL